MLETDLDALLAAATLHHQAGRLDQAAALYRQVLAAHSGHAKANHLLGAVLVAQGRPQEGEELLGRAAGLDPSQPNYRYSHGVVLQMLGDADGAAAAYEATLRVAPDHAQAHNNLGVLAQSSGRHQQAITHFRRVTELAPALAAGHFNLANALADLDERQAAIAAYRQAASLDPARAEILYNLAATLRQDGQLEAAAEAFAQVLARDPGHIQARAQRAFLKQHFADWSSIAALERELVQPALAAPPERAVSPFLFLALPLDVSPATLRQLAGKMQARFPAGPPLTRRDLPDRVRPRLRIGYVSADFFDHATAHLTRGLFARHDRRAVEVFGYALGSAHPDDPYRCDIAQGCDQFVDLGFLSARAAAERIAADKIDILIDLKGHTQANRLGLFAHRPAPIQVTWLGYPGTTGLDFIDYALVDKIVAPPAHQPHYSEKLVWLPDTYQVNDDTQPIAATAPTRAQCGLPETGFVFCCFNAVSKIEPAIFAVWMRILTQTPGSVLWLLADQPRAQENLRREAAARGVDPARLVFAGPIAKDAHLARHRHADLFLDTFFYNAHTTASDALWAGVPVVTCPGQTFARRVAASLLNAIGLRDLIASDLPAYEALAIRLAREPSLLRDIRTRLAANRTRSALFDTARFARHLESAFRLMWGQFERNETPAAIEVPPLPASAMAPPAPASIDVGALLAAAIRAAESGDVAKAAALGQEILATQPDNAQALHLLATIEANAGRLPAALALAERAVAAAPADADHQYLRAVLLQMLGDGAAAATAYESVLQIAPEHASAHNNLGVLHQSAGRHDVAARHFREVARLAADLAAGHFNLANALDELGDKDGAIASLRRAIAIEPGRIEFQYNLATALRHVGDLEGARDGYEKARQIDPTHLSTMAQLALVRLQLCDWRGIDRLRDDLVRPALATQGARAATPFVFLVLPTEISAAELRRIAANYGAKHAVRQRLPTPKDRHRPRLRIGYVSADFRNHATAHLVRSLFARHDRAAVEIVGYSLGLSNRDSTYRQVIEQGCDRFVDLGFAQPEAAARQIHQDNIDILVDLKGHTQDNRIGLFAFRPAPVQVTWLGYPGTTGVDFFDYALVDKIVAPEADQPHFSEKLVWLPECYQVNDDTQPVATQTSTRAQCGLPERGFVFCSFNAAYKVEPVIFDVWMRILAQVPDSVLWLFPGSLPTQAYLRREAEARGIDPQRLVFAPHRRKDQHLARHGHADLFLDTYFCNAHTTASDSLWAGVPVLTCPGPTFARRVAASLLTAVGLSELIAPDLSAYERRAVALTRDPAALTALRQRLAVARDTGPLFDTTRFARHLERAYRVMWEIYERGETPRGFAVPALPASPRRAPASASDAPSAT